MRLLALLWLALPAAALAANSATFVSQTVPTVMVPGQVYAVSVTMQNNGTTTWTTASGYKLGTQNPQDNTLWTGTTRKALPSGASIGPGQQVTFSFNVTAPSTPGTYNFQWKMLQESIEWFGALSTNVAVNVGLNDAAFASQSVPPVMQPGQSYAVTVTMNNNGGKTWATATGHRLGSQNPQDNSTWVGPRVNLPSTTAPGANAAFSFNVTAPSTAGTYNFQWKMVQDGVEWFGALSANLAIKVGLDNAALVSQSVPSTMVTGQSYSVSVTMQNTGSTTWPAGSTVGLGSQNPAGNTTWGPSKVNLSSSVAPSAQTTFNFNVTAPSSPGSYNFQWKMVEGSNGWFGAQSTNVAVNVTAGSPATNVYFIHTDHLNTPRLVANSSGTTVWRWDQQEPFGVNAADENPSSLGNFEFALRFPGQYADKETNLHQNYFRDFDPVIGRYTRSDPIGLRGGIDTYSYVGGNALSFADPRGLLLTTVDAFCMQQPDACAELIAQVVENTSIVTQGCVTEGAAAAANAIQDLGIAATVINLSAAVKSVAAAGLGVAVKTSAKGAPKYDELVKEAQKVYPSKAGKLENHHIEPKYLGGSPKGPTAKIDAAYHQQITNEFRDLWPYGQSKPSAGQVQKIMNDVYTKYPLP